MRTEGTTKVREALRDYLKALKTGEGKQRAAFVHSRLSCRWARRWQVLGFVWFWLVTSWGETSSSYQAKSLLLSNVAASRCSWSSPELCLWHTVTTALPARPSPQLLRRPRVWSQAGGDGAFLQGQMVIWGQVMWERPWFFEGRACLQREAAVRLCGSW